MSSRPDQREPAPGDWLEGCIGFVVESDGSRVGRVDEVQRDADSGRPVALVVRGGVAGWHRRVVPVDEVAGVLPSSDRIILNAAPAPVAGAQAAPSLHADAGLP
jgi:sporulation protein YlmC with PRC-barrel domain